MSVKMKMRIIGALLSVCLLLSACGAGTHKDEAVNTDTTAQTPEQETLSTEPSKQPEETVRGPVFEEIPKMEDDYYQYGNMQINVPSGDFLLYNGEVVFDVRSKTFLYSYNLTTGEVRLFCASEGCDHRGSACVSVKNYSVLEQYGGKLYAKDSESVVKTLVDGKWADLVKSNRRFWHGDGDLYTVTRKGELQVYADGTGEPRTILEDYDYYWNVVFDGYLYGATAEEVIRVDLRSETPVKEILLEDVYSMVEGNHIYYAEEENYHLYRCDMDGTNRQLLLDKPVLPASINFGDEYVYFRLYTDKQLEGTADSNDIYRMSKADPARVEKITTLPESAYQIFTVPGLDVLFVTARVYYDEHGAQRENIYVMNTDGRNMTQLELPE